MDVGTWSQRSLGQVSEPVLELAPAPQGETAFAAVNIGAVGESCGAAPHLLQIATGEMRPVAEPYSVYGKGNLPVGWNRAATRVYFNGGELDLETGEFTPLLPAGIGTWLGWALDPERGPVAALVTDGVSARANLVLFRDGAPVIRTGVGWAAKGDGLFYPSRMFWDAAGETVIFETFESPWARLSSTGCPSPRAK